MKPVLFVTNHVAARPRRRVRRAARARGARARALRRALAPRAAGVADPGVPHRHVGPARDPRARRRRGATARSSAAPPAASRCRRRGRRAPRAASPFVLWSALWAHPRTPAHLVAGAPLRRLYRSADAVVAYGPHVAAFARARGARNVHVAPQAVDNAFWAAPVHAASAARRSPRCFSAGRAGKRRRRCCSMPGASQVWSSAGRARPRRRGTGPPRAPPAARWPRRAAAARPGPQLPAPPRTFGHTVAADAHFREPWGLVANEAMNQSTPVIASDEVGAVAGGLVRHERNGSSCPPATRRAGGRAAPPARRPRAARALGRQRPRDVAAYTFEAWAAGFAGAGRGRRRRAGRPLLDSTSDAAIDAPDHRCTRRPARPLLALAARAARRRLRRDDSHPRLHRRRGHVEDATRRRSTATRSRARRPTPTSTATAATSSAAPGSPRRRQSQREAAAAAAAGGAPGRAAAAGDRRRRGARAARGGRRRRQRAPRADAAPGRRRRRPAERQALDDAAVGKDATGPWAARRRASAGHRLPTACRGSARRCSPPRRRRRPRGRGGIRTLAAPCPRTGAP